MGAGIMRFEESEWTDNFEEYREVASRYMKSYYYITWDDACGDEEPIRRTIERNESPTAFVDWWATKYDLTSLADDRYEYIRFVQRNSNN